MGEGAAPRESSSVSIGDLWPEINRTESTGGEGAFVTAAHGHLEALVSHSLSGARVAMKGKTVVDSRDACEDCTFRQASERSSIQKKSYNGDSMKDKTAKFLIDSKAGTSDDLPHCVRRSFNERRYSSSTGMDRSEWEIILEQLLVMGLILKEEVVSDDND
jgi:hypothetical protein